MRTRRRKSCPYKRVRRTQAEARAMAQKRLESMPILEYTLFGPMPTGEHPKPKRGSKST